jgi:hypothetical protein
MPMGAPEKHIPADAPAKRLAERLRELRRAAGTPSYRQMGRAVYAQHNTLSRVASGEYVTWPSVENYVSALKAVGGRVTDDQVDELRELWQEAKIRHTAQPAADAPTTVTPTMTINVPTAENFANFAIPFPVPLFARVTGKSVPDSVVHTWLPTSGPHVSYQYHQRPELGVVSPRPWDDSPTELAEIMTTQALVAALNDLVQEHRIDLRELRTEPGAHDFTRFGGVSHRDGEEAWEVLTGRRAPSLSAVYRIVVHICGRPERDFHAWSAAWQRVQQTQPISAAVPALPIAATPASDTRTAADPDVDDDASVTVTPAVTAADRHPRRPLWRRMLRLR